MVDSYRSLYPDIVKKKTTFSSSSVSCRLDRFYIYEHISNDILTCGKIPFGHGDHDSVYLQLKTDNGIDFG